MSRSHEQSSRWPKPSRSRPLALRPEDFDALGGRRSHDLQRRMDAWASGVAPRLANFGLKPADHAREIHGPVVHFAVRGAARDAAHIVLGMDGARVRAGLELPASEAETARARLSDSARALELTRALEALPEQFTMGVLDEAEGIEASRATADDVRALIDRIERERGAMWIGWTIPREVALEHAAVLDELLADAIVALAKVFALVGADVASRRPARRDRDATKRRRLSRRRARVDGSEDDERDRGPMGTYALADRARGGDPSERATAQSEALRRCAALARWPQPRRREAPCAAERAAASIEGVVRRHRKRYAGPRAQGAVLGQSRRGARARRQGGRAGQCCGPARRAPRSEQTSFPRPKGADGRVSRAPTENPYRPARDPPVDNGRPDSSIDIRWSVTI